MKVPRFWHREWVRVPSLFSDGTTWSIPRWGWSETSQDEAEKMAAERCWQTKQKWNANANQNSNDWYRGKDYFGQPPREEIIQEVNNAEGGVDGWVSRNRYGVLVLNTDVLLMIDVDKKETPMRKAASGLWAKWFGGQVLSEEQRLIELCKSQNHDSFRLYRTYAGWRVLMVNRSVEGVTSEAVEIMKRFPVDPFYLKLCDRQQCFRARLTAKPWRIGVARCGYDYPRQPIVEPFFNKWEQEYNQAATKFRVCEKIFGLDAPCERLRQLVELHDSLCQVSANLPLA